MFEKFRRRNFLKKSLKEYGFILHGTHRTCDCKNELNTVYVLGPITKTFTGKEYRKDDVQVGWMCLDCEYGAKGDWRNLDWDTRIPLAAFIAEHKPTPKQHQEEVLSLLKNELADLQGRIKITENTIHELEIAKTGSPYRL
jgi:hypothetical protein